MSNVTCLGFPEDPYKCDVITAVRRASGSLSFVGCLFTMFIMWWFNRYVVFTQRLILYLAVAAFFDSIAFIMSSNLEDGPLCDFQGWFVTYFHWQVLLCVCCITFNLCMIVIAEKHTEKYEWLYISVCCVVPLVMSCLPFSGDHYGPSGAWCWLKEDVKWRMGIWYGPLYFCIAALTVAYGCIIYTMRKKALAWKGLHNTDKENQHSQVMDEIKSLILYPIMYLVASLFPLTNRIQNSVSDSHLFWLVVVSCIASALHGALNAVAFGLDRQTFSQLRMLTPSEIKMKLRAKFFPKAQLEEYKPGVNFIHMEAI